MHSVVLCTELAAGIVLVKRISILIDAFTYFIICKETFNP